jgi:hypothetical protein
MIIYFLSRTRCFSFSMGMSKMLGEFSFVPDSMPFDRSPLTSKCVDSSKEQCTWATQPQKFSYTLGLINCWRCEHIFNIYAIHIEYMLTIPFSPIKSRLPADILKINSIYDAYVSICNKIIPLNACRILA